MPSQGQAADAPGSTASAAPPIAAQQPAQQHLQFLGDASAAVPVLAEVDFGGGSLPDGLTKKDVEAFRRLYQDHCDATVELIPAGTPDTSQAHLVSAPLTWQTGVHKPGFAKGQRRDTDRSQPFSAPPASWKTGAMETAFLEAVMNLHFSTVESLWQDLWGSNDCREPEKGLSQSKLRLLSKCEAVQKFVQHADYQFYQNLVDVLIPDVLRPIPIREELQRQQLNTNVTTVSSLAEVVYERQPQPSLPVQPVISHAEVLRGTPEHSFVTTPTHVAEPLFMAAPPETYGDPAPNCSGRSPRVHA
ncbi:hypothetical protein HPB51_005125 [Rhipicephalus microplus]|uniref:RFX1-4/6/8-like BCD domain-containing protein n=1 Tax=Rhipicephalus microplus TaxID=6941 RepID=A0A9J6ELS9_RHIMP|nr:hypothetical protein HPB51_005125 [Rhipicephalus microplus]